eukprot:11966276-Karenia_brevis.AAC.1
MVAVANVQRRKLIKESGNEFLVVWEDVYNATKKTLRAQGALTGGVRMPSLDWFKRIMRQKTEVRARPGKTCISHTEEHQRARHKLGLEWQQYPKSFWETGIHAYIDSKRYVVPRNAKDKKLLRALCVRHHLRTPAEGKEQDFMLPKRGRLLTGIPSVNVTAAVGDGRILMWHITEGGWNGAAASTMYEDLGSVLRATYGSKRKFRVVEDGDPKGFQSSKGKQAKEEQRIESWTLAPHSPGLMPLDYSLWKQIESRTLGKQGRDNESAKSYVRRLSKIALSLPGDVVQKC